MPRTGLWKRETGSVGVLAAARAAQVDVQEAEARKLAAAVAWAGLHQVDDPGLAETRGDTPVTLAGEGAPLIATGCVAESGAVIGTTANGGRPYLADALDLDATLDREAETPVAKRPAGQSPSTSTCPPTPPRPTAVAENGGGHLLTQTQVAAWCGNPNATITVKPVINLNEAATSSRYDVSDRLKEHVELRDRTCVFPHCGRPAGSCQKDHVQAHSDGGATDTTNVASR